MVFDDIGIIFFVLRFSDAGSARPSRSRAAVITSGIRSALYDKEQLPVGLTRGGVRTAVRLERGLVCSEQVLLRLVAANDRFAVTRAAKSSGFQLARRRWLCPQRVARGVHLLVRHARVEMREHALQGGKRVTSTRSSSVSTRLMYFEVK